MPPAVRETWLGIRDGLTFEGTGMDDATPNRGKIFSKDDFEGCCAMPWNTKCAKCRTTLVEGELGWVPIIAFKEGQWLRPGHMLNRALPLAPGWEEPSATVYGEMRTRARIIDNQISYGCCPTCTKDPWKLPFYSTR